MVGQAIVEEGRSRGAEVIVGSSREGAGDQVVSVTDTAAIQDLAATVDAVVISVPPPRDGSSHAEWTAANERLAHTPLDARLVLVGGAGTTEVDGVRLLDAPGFPEDYKAEAVSVGAVLDTFVASTDAPDWTILSPAPEIGPGTRTGEYRTGTDEVVGDTISTQDFAVALWDELEKPAHRGARFTVAN